ncbi:LacI family DNA-binding transcriptional regulator [Polynucleobacter sp.]|jgi:LacI family transcriptional regulator|uniref:LacI family DNA-binding transcriptional regulator n=1 Tax=Polynucleobacter sp. TaxID=2029855 RepID=UPI0037C7098D
MNKFVTIGDVARHAGVSVATVSRIHNGIAGRATPETVARVQQSIEALDYRPHSVSRALKMKQSRIVGVLVANLANPAMAAIAESIEESLRSKGYVMALCDTHERPDIQDQYLREMESHLAIAVVMVVAVKSEMLVRLQKQGRPIVFVARRDPLRKNSSFVGIDDFAAGETVAKYCISEKLNSPCVIYSSLEHSADSLRFAGVKERYKQIEKSKKIPNFTIPARNHLEIGYQAARDCMKIYPATDALICLSDLIAYGAYRWIREHKSKCQLAPRIFGFDDNPLNDWINPWLTSVRFPYQALGATVVDSLTSMLENNSPQDYVLPHQLIVRSQ